MDSKVYAKLLNDSTSEEQKLYREGMDLFLGITRPKDTLKALEMLYKASDLGYIPAILRYHAYCGISLRAKADILLAKGAEMGDPICCYIYATICKESARKSDQYILEMYDIAKKSGFDVNDDMFDIIQSLPPDLKKQWSILQV